MKLFQSINGHGRIFLRSLGRRYYAAQPEEYVRRNYANNVSEYNTVVGSVTAQRRHFLLRDVYDDMMIDGVQPSRDTFHPLIAGTMKGARLQDAFFFRDEMKAMGLLPDVTLYNFLISVCGKCKRSEHAIQILEEMKRNEVKPTGQTFICLLNACAATGKLDRVYAIVRDMTAAGLGLNKFCYAGLISAHKNRVPVADDTAAKIIELVEQSKGWSSPEQMGPTAENVMMGVFPEDLYNLPTAEYFNRRGGFVDKRLTVYHAASHALADLRNVEAMETLLRMLERDNNRPDAFTTMQVMRCYLHAGDLDRGYQVFEEFMNSGRPPYVELYVTLVEGAMVGYTPKGMQIAQDALVNMTSKNVFLNPRMASDLLLIAAGEKTGGYTTANYLWDLMQARNVVPSQPAVEAYFDGLREREIPKDEPRLLKVIEILDNYQARFNSRS
ncbi:pentatricopeptide repeat-containing protein At4g35850, mitochondrial-like isoform X2 [Chenopodium quinoa]|uniref:pentatricopeptide repeat-containing protein At4g35850, mitochondrial-like isoform X2 n=1 Tax=Chenopodium quinoa TaxID=63459 RepID=UPI000B774D23|nr:pentatricopeptide repeat-containing protein At4g35850, mitochondrial-like isoform X2 [Chenopodium quinoa]